MNRTTPLLATLALSLALPVLAQTPITSYTLEDDCGTPVDNVGEEGELYAIKVGSTPVYTDWLFDLRTKNGGRAGLAELDSVGLLIPSNWRVPETGTDDVHVITTFADGVLAVDSGNIDATLGSFNFVRRQHVGDSLPSGPPLQGRDLVISQGAAQYRVDLGGRFAWFPRGGPSSIDIAFAPIADVQNTDLSGASCTWGGEVGDKHATGMAAGQGLIRGYNVYRLAGSAGAPPTIDQVRQLDNWVYFVDLHSLNFSVPEPDQDLNVPGDLVGVDNDDAQPYTGDEVLLFSDQAANPNGSARAGGKLGPHVGQGFWYALQPVVQGNVSDFANVVISNRPAADLRLDLDGDTLHDAVNLDPDMDPTGASPEFISPQAEAGITGLGLTWHGAGLCRYPFYGEMNPAPAVGSLSLRASVQGARVELELATGIEAANVLGYVVYRVDGRTRSQVGSLLVARGGEGAVYHASDRLVAGASRQLRAGNVRYEVQVLFNDGTAPENHGPFEVTETRRDGGRPKP